MNHENVNAHGRLVLDMSALLCLPIYRNSQALPIYFWSSHVFTYSQVPNKRPPRLLFFGFFQPPDLIRTPRSLILEKLNLLRACYVISFVC